MDTLIERCAGIDIGKDEVVACVRTPKPGGRGRIKTTRTFATFTASLEAMLEWFAAEGVSAVVMEATGSYWKPVWYLLEERPWELLLVNAHHVKILPGRKSDLLTELPGRCGGREVRGPAGLARFPRRDQRRGCAPGAVRAGGAAGRVA